jgi:hypothetical protein
MLCAPQRRASRRARQRALELTNTEIESSQGRTTDEAIVGGGGFAIHVGIDISEWCGLRAAQKHWYDAELRASVSGCQRSCRLSSEITTVC